MTENPSEVIARLSARLDALEQRVAQLEHPVEAIPAPVLAPLPIPPKPAAQQAAPAALPNAGGTFPVLGKALLGIAGAYLLRALAEAGKSRRTSPPSSEPAPTTKSHRDASIERNTTEAATRNSPVTKAQTPTRMTKISTM